MDLCNKKSPNPFGLKLTAKIDIHFELYKSVKPIRDVSGLHS